MASKFNKVIMLFCLMLGICEAQSGLKTGSFAGPPGEWQSKASDLESSLHKIETAQSVDQARLSTITKVFSDKLSQLDGDVRATKTLLNQLVEGSVTVSRHLRAVDGMTTDIDNLQAQLNRTHYGLSSFLATLDHSVKQLQQKLRDQTQTQESIQAHNGAEMTQLSDQIDALRDVTAGQNTRMQQLEDMLRNLNQTIASQPTSSSDETLQGTIREVQETIKALTARLDNKEKVINNQMLALRNEIEDVRREARRSSAYPYQK